MGLGKEDTQQHAHEGGGGWAGPGQGWSGAGCPHHMSGGDSFASPGASWASHAAAKQAAMSRTGSCCSSVTCEGGWVTPTRAAGSPAGRGGCARECVRARACTHVRCLVAGGPRQRTPQRPPPARRQPATRRAAVQGAPTAPHPEARQDAVERPAVRAAQLVGGEAAHDSKHVDLLGLPNAHSLIKRAKTARAAGRRRGRGGGAALQLRQ